MAIAVTGSTMVMVGGQLVTAASVVGTRPDFQVGADGRIIIPDHANISIDGKTTMPATAVAQWDMAGGGSSARAQTINNPLDLLRPIVSGGNVGAIRDAFGRLPGFPSTTTGGGGGGEVPKTPEELAEDSQKEREQRNIYATIEATLAEYELDTPEMLALVKRLIESDASPAEIWLEVRKTQTWKDRFAGNEERLARGLNALDPQAYIQYERDARRLFSEAGLPDSFYDHRSDFVGLIGRDVSLRELQRRVQDGFVQVTQAPIEIRQAFANYFGVQGDAALAALFLNYDRAVEVLMKQVAAAEFGGTGTRFGLQFGRSVAERAADLGISRDQAEAGFGKILEFKPLFEETITERDDFTAEREGANSVFGFQPTDIDKIRQRRAQRLANMGGAIAGSVVTQGGALGMRAISSRPSQTG
jgi:hypothetical protein